jgi:hypothetical protein
MRTWTAVGSLALVMLLAACAADGEPLPDDGVAEPSPAPPTPTPPEPQLVMDWREPFELALPNGWIVRDCEGERLTTCVYDGEVFLGDIELAPGYPLDDDQAAQEPQELLRTWARDFLEDLAEDRADGCPAFTYTADEVVDATVGGQPGTRASFTLTDDTGRVVERVINHYTLHNGMLTLVNTDAYVEEGGCLGPSEFDPSFTPESLADLEPYLDRLVADTPLVGIDHD